MLLHLSVLAMILLLSLVFENRIRTEKLVPVLGGESVNKRNSMLLVWVLFFALITFYASVRRYTNDTDVYVYLFNLVDPSWDNIRTIITDTSKDKGFYILQNLFKMYISKDFHMWFLFIASIESVIYISVFRKRAVSFLDSMYFFFCAMLYFNYFSMMRQWFAVSITFLGISFLEKKKFIPFLLICVFAAQFHNSAFFIIPVYFLVGGVPWGKKQISLIGIFACLMLFLQPILSATESATQGSTYSYVVSTMASNNGSSIIRPIIAVVPVVLAFLARDRMVGKDKTIDICTNFSLLNFLLSFMAVFTSGLYLTRLSTYFNIYNVILYPYLLNVVYKDRPNEKLIKTGFYIFYFAFYMFDMTNSSAFPYFSDVIGLYS